MRTRDASGQRDAMGTGQLQFGQRRHGTASVDGAALGAAVRPLGWRVYATNQPADQGALEQARRAYRDESLVERRFGRLKGQPLLLTPRSLERDDHATD